MPPQSAKGAESFIIAAVELFKTLTTINQRGKSLILIGTLTIGLGFNVQNLNLSNTYLGLSRDCLAL